MGLVRDIRLPNGRLAHPGSTWLQHKTVSSINAANFLNKAHSSPKLPSETVAIRHRGPSHYECGAAAMSYYCELVRVERFELPTPPSQAECATGLRYTRKIGGPGGIEARPPECETGARPFIRYDVTLDGALRGLSCRVLQVTKTSNDANMRVAIVRHAY